MSITSHTSEILPLTNLRETFDNDKEILTSILDMFLIEVPQDYLLLKQQIDSGAYSTAGMQAHKLKSSYRTIGVTDMASILQKIENIAKNEVDNHQIPNLLEQFNSHYEQVNAQILHTKEQL